MSWEAVIGLEIHAQLTTRSKLFSGSSTAYGAAPNTQASLVDLGYPGVLPVLNAEAVRMAALFGLAIGATVAPRSVFARKNYFYPDLPKGYQISQYELPIVQHGHLDIELDDGSTKAVHVIRAHLEEDAGKSLHEQFPGLTGIDLNRTGTPLLEIVSAPDLRSAAEAVAYMKKMHQLVRHLGICDGNMQEGSFRCDANVSVRRKGADKLGTRTESKNLNSFRFLERAILFEIDRQIDVLESGGTVVQETRLYDPDRDETRPMRSKEEANDYRYFPDPDLLPVVLEPGFIDAVRGTLPELPAVRQARWVRDFGLKPDAAAVIVAEPDNAALFDALAAASGEPVVAANTLQSQLFSLFDAHRGAGQVNVSVVATILRLTAEGVLARNGAKALIEEFAFTEGSPDLARIVDERGLRQISDSGAVEQLVDQVLAANPAQVAQYRAGQQKVLGFLVGQVIKASGGKANPAQVNQLLNRKLAD
ncbi:MAG: Asp-tRNA(Asn)/Glu-tRNA(Gln) amidotransferase subunit GatB [Gammaproteobacteria bacterium PRO9]|nr:Asp-tRNA(Asn)/Glu-tRNA(Gln) amidotransferase subunit GatB [Gammaproteobacteria bacterium PRO9]